MNRIKAIRRCLRVEGFWMTSPVFPIMPPPRMREDVYLAIVEELWRMESRACNFLRERFPLTPISGPPQRG